MFREHDHLHFSRALIHFMLLMFSEVYDSLSYERIEEKRLQDLLKVTQSLAAAKVSGESEDWK